MLVIVEFWGIFGVIVWVSLCVVRKLIFMMLRIGVMFGRFV